MVFPVQVLLIFKKHSESEMKLNILRLIVAALCCTSALMVIANVGAQKSLPVRSDFAASLTSLGIATPAQTPAAAAAPQEQTVEQTHKNIQVLKGLPDSQLGPVMNYFAASMGRRCNFCHVNNNGQWDWVWESDDKEEKQTARSMIKMVLAINKDNFRGNIQVSCYTCHRGRNQPNSIPSFPLPTPPPGPAAGGPVLQRRRRASPSPTPTPAPPTADQILAKYTDAIGGQAAIDKMKTRVMKGTYAGFNGAELVFEASLTAPDKFYVIVTTPQGTSERGFDGKVAWEKNARGVNELTNPVLDQMKSMFLSFSNIKLKEEFTRLRLGGRDKIGDRDVVIVSGTTTDNHRARLFFDTETGLLLRRSTLRR